MAKVMKHIDDVELREWIEQEIRSAMKQELEYNGMSGLRRHGVARVRANRILAKLDKFNVPGMKRVRDAAVLDAVQKKMDSVAGTSIQ